MTPTDLATWNEANRRARAEYYRDPFAACRDLSYAEAGIAYARGEINLKELVRRRRRVQSW